MQEPDLRRDHHGVRMTVLVHLEELYEVVWGLELVGM